MPHWRNRARCSGSFHQRRQGTQSGGGDGVARTIARILTLPQRHAIRHFAWLRHAAKLAPPRIDQGRHAAQLPDLRAFNLQDDEARRSRPASPCSSCCSSAIFTLRPVRETMGITGGVDNLHWLFTGTFFATLAAMPLLAGSPPACAAAHPVIGCMVFAANLLPFAAGFIANPDDVWLAHVLHLAVGVQHDRHLAGVERAGRLCSPPPGPGSACSLH